MDGEIEKKYCKYREFATSSGKFVIGGKNAEQNEKVVEQAGKEEVILHTKEAGSPFCNIKSRFNNLTKKDIKEAAIFCARYSRDWKKNVGDVEVHWFLGKEVFKEKNMKTGTFGVKKAKSINVKKEDIMRFQKEGLNKA